ncbi:hypothetical protein Gohar_006989 [Gossypium harknessii]|uniref:Uncharacterized protein n=1 Tax=Gossypium harknessii TaxID=34285 RepID=A0A7J9GF54_9ROSI|nr:hypothetical protein [Gossypium harknessii]
MRKVYSRQWVLLRHSQRNRNISAQVMKLVNNLVKTPQLVAKIQEFSKEMIKARVIEEIVALNSEITDETAAQL